MERPWRYWISTSPTCGEGTPVSIQYSYSHKVFSTAQEWRQWHNHEIFPRRLTQENHFCRWPMLRRVRTYQIPGRFVSSHVQLENLAAPNSHHLVGIRACLGRHDCLAKRGQPRYRDPAGAGFCRQHPRNDDGRPDRHDDHRHDRAARGFSRTNQAVVDHQGSAGGTLEAVVSGFSARTARRRAHSTP